MKPHIEDFFEFLEKKENKPIPLKVRLANSDHYKISPEELNIEGDLDLEGRRIRQLPDNLKVGGSLNLENTLIEQLPDNLKVEGTLYLEQATIEQLPDNLKVGGDLHLEGSTIKQFPNNLKVGRSLFLYRTPISWTMSREQIRKEIEQKGGYVRGDISIGFVI
jgi:hypothetical protein